LFVGLFLLPLLFVQLGLRLGFFSPAFLVFLVGFFAPCVCF
jgi:hypothetical protein